MLYHVIRRPPHHNSNETNKSKNTSGSSVSVQQLMPRYHYSRINPNSVSTNSDSYFTRNYSGGHSAKPPMTAAGSTTTTTSNQQHGPYKSTFIPLVTNSRTATPIKREFVQIPITREDGTTITIPNSTVRSVPITYFSEATTLPSTNNHASTNSNSNGSMATMKPHLTSLFRPTSRFFQHHFHSTNGDEPSLTASTTNIPRLPSVSRRLSLTIPVMTTTTDDDSTTTATVPSSSSIRQIPIRLPQPTSVASIPTNSSRISSAILRSAPMPNSSQFQRQKTDLTDASSSSTTVAASPPDFTLTPSSSISPLRRAEVMAREAIQGIARLQHQRNGSTGMAVDNSSVRSPSLSRRVIINLKNNQSVQLDSRLSSANSPPTKPPQTSSSSRLIQRNNLYHIPILHEIQMPPHPATAQADLSLQSSPPITNGNYKNEFRMEIPVTIATNYDQENRMQPQRHEGGDGGGEQDDEQQQQYPDRVPSAPALTLKSILKRSSSRETVSRKNVSFMNA